MFAKVMAAALAIGATGGASIAVAQNAMAGGFTAASATREAKVGDTCAPVAFRVYFEPNSTRLNTEALDTIDAATRQVAGCDRVEFNLAAAPGQIADATDRRRVSERSVAVLSAMREHGVHGDVYVQPVSHSVVAAERNVGPDFIEIAVAPSQAPQLITSNSRQRDM